MARRKKKSSTVSTMFDPLYKPDRVKSSKRRRSRKRGVRREGSATSVMRDAWTP